ncbi:MAG: N-acetylneuraminate synthase family protein [Candidatus Paceibacterota bacterium]|jgi:N-acetylneuraminate synthase
MRNPFLIGEVGINHNGDMDIARQLIRQAKDCDWDAVKFQKRTIDTIYSKEFLDSPRESPWGNTQRSQKEGLEFSVEQMGELFDYARSLGLEPFASAWDIKSLHEVESLNPKFHKVASPFITYDSFLMEIAAIGKHTFISTGMSTMLEISHAVKLFNRYRCPFTLLHCVSTYPCPEEATNLKMIPELRKAFGCEVGYSGHETGILPSVIAAALGATVIERHITLDRSMYGSDQSASLEKRGMELLSKYVRAIPLSMGDGVKKILAGEAECRKKLCWWEAA